MIEALLRDHLLSAARIYADAKNIKLATVGRHFHGDHRFLDNIVEGRTFTLATYTKFLTALHENWPDGVKWPRGVPLPGKTYRLVAVNTAKRSK